jgi:hypothetical protein
MRSARCPSGEIGKAPESTPRLFLAGAFLLAISSSAVGCSFYDPSVKDYARTRPDGGATDAGGALSSGGQGGDNSIGGQMAVGGDPPIDAGDAGAPPACIAQQEICNGLDDDCDGTIDNGCPSDLLRGNAIKETALGDSPGGSAFADVCANDELVVGLQVALRGYLDQTTALCQKYTLQVDTRGVPYQYSVGYGATEYLTSHPTSTDSALTPARCPDGTFLVGMHAYQQYLLLPTDPNPELTGISILCAQLSVDLTLASPVLDWTTAVEVGPFLGTNYDSTKATLKTDLLDMGRVVVGIHGSAGPWIDTVGLTSSSVQVLLR